MRPGVSIMFNVNPALAREIIIGLKPSDYKNSNALTMLKKAKTETQTKLREIKQKSKRKTT